MTILGIETSCDECSAGLVRDGKTVLSNLIFTQIKQHEPYAGVVPEIASRLHVEWIYDTVEKALREADLRIEQVDAVAVTHKPGLVGSLLVGLSFAKGLALSRNIPLIGVDHIPAHLYAVQLERDVPYPFLGLLVSGGHTVLCVVRDFDQMEVLGGTVDDACGEAFDKVAKFYEMGYPGGPALQKAAGRGDPKAFIFPHPILQKRHSVYDVSYSGLKTAVINHPRRFLREGAEFSTENLAASFQKVSVDLLIKVLKKAIHATGINRIVAGGGVVANTYLRESLSSLGLPGVYYPSMKLCTDNGAMIAGIGYRYFKKGKIDSFSLKAVSREPLFRKNLSS